MATIPNGLTKDQFVLALHSQNPQYAYRFTSATDYEWRGPGDQPADQAIADAWTAYQAAQQAAADAAAAHETAINLNPPITDLEAARDALATARTALQTAVATYNSGDTQIQAMGASPSAAALATALKGLSANNRAFIAAQIDADQAIVDGLQALETGIKRLRTRFA